MHTLKDLKWKRPRSTEFPKVWRSFNAVDIDSGKIVEYSIQDLPESRFKDGIDFMGEHFCKDEPICEAFGICDEVDAVENFKQKMVLACLKNGSDEIIGMNANYVKCKEDNFMQVIYSEIKNEKIKKYGELMSIIRENFDIFEVYGVDKHLSCIGLVVDKKYRRRGIGEQFLHCRKAICNQFGISLTSTVFTADSSNRIADKVGFTLDKSIMYEDLLKSHPQIKLPPIKSDAMTIKSIVF
ncbi:uncharacterized protein LOC116340630 [Contarinia nasturtii]|uniref:uncharacterized protein LOC116340630 n=1 Tax=Contarinia nasturtii TaxID=265458 RepID=UPI0012D3ADBF|nr:uncharacterized protein LOC116340630 [Contarinia nasturtii]